MRKTCEETCGSFLGHSEETEIRTMNIRDDQISCYLGIYPELVLMR